MLTSYVTTHTERMPIVARFTDALAALTGLEETLPPSWSDDLSSAYNDDILEASGPIDSANARIAELESANAALAAEVQQVKAHNYELMMQVGAPESKDDDTNAEDNSDEDESESDDAQQAIDDLFE